VPAVVEGLLAERGARPRARKQPRQADLSGIIEVEIDGVTIWVGRGADAKTVTAVIRVLKAGA